MKRNRYNWKARQIVNTAIDHTNTKKIELDLTNNEGRYDESNPLVLPSEKRKTKQIKQNAKQVTRLLSKKRRKLLEKVVERKQKKEQRASLLEALSKIQATPIELQELTSIATIQTKGLKRYFFEEQAEIKEKLRATESDEVQIDSLKGSKRKSLVREQLNYDKNDANIVGFESSDDDGSDEEIEKKRSKLNFEENKVVINYSDNDDDDDNIKEGEEIEGVEKQQEIIVVDDHDSIKEESEVVEMTDNKREIKLEKKPSVFVQVYRTEEIQAARLKLPILAEEQQIMELINENSVVIIAGETGSGKTTQIPQFLYEAGYALKQQIGITEPRRVAAISMSQRVAEEMNLSTQEVSYLIRFEGNVTDHTKIKFMTDGVLLKELQSDFLLSKYSVIILDEAHERSVYTDILIGFLSRIVPLRHKRNNPLKLIIMSATLRLEDFTENRRLFKIPPPVFKVDVRQYPVIIHFNKRTNDNYLKEAFNKTVKIHTKLPDGGILIFLTGQQEVQTLVKRLRNAFPLRQKKIIRQIPLNNKKKKKIKFLPEINLDDYSVFSDNDDFLSDESINFEDNDDDNEEQQKVLSATQPLWVLPLYSLLSSTKQAEVFKPPPENCRLCIVSTNVAETSLTIPNIKYVVDCGKIKQKLYDKVTGVNSFTVTWTSKASADQRAGRAGRLGPGHCYRLYSSAVFNDEFPQFNVPEIKQKPIDDLFLKLKNMKIHKVSNFPFPTAPDLQQLKTAEDRLNILGVLKDCKITPLGKVVIKFPVLPRYGKMLALSHQFDLLPYTICLVAALSVQEVLLETPIGEKNDADEVSKMRQKWLSVRKQWAGAGNYLLLGDNMVLLRAVGAAEYANSEGKLEQFCQENGLRHKAIIEIRKLRLQLTNEININVRDADITVDPKLPPPTDLQAKLLRQLMLAGMGDQVARKIMPDEIKEGENKAKYKYAYRACNLEEPIFLHQASVLRNTLPEFVVYHEIYETNRMYMRGISAIEPEWLITYVPTLCNLSEPLNEPEPTYDSDTGKVYCSVTGTFGPQAWQLPCTKIEFPKTLSAYKWFARFLLEGKVFKQLEKYVKTLLSSPATMLRVWAKLQPRTENFLKALIAKEITSKMILMKVWEENPQYLLEEYLQWLPMSVQGEVTLLWPPKD